MRTIPHQRRKALQQASSKAMADTHKKQRHGGFVVRIENFVFADLSTSTQVHPCHLEETKATENVPWRRGYYDQPRSWESDGPGPGDVTDITRKFMAQKARLPPVDVAPRRTIEEKMSDKARQLSQHAAKKRRQLQHLKHAEESSSSSTSSASSDSDDDE